jgi:hypothetical protein
MGIAPLAVAGIAFRYVALPLIIGAGSIAAAGALVKSAAPDVPISKSNLPTASLLGGAAAAAYFGASLLPKNWQPVAYVAAALGMGGSLYYMFKTEPAEVPTTEGGEEGLPPAAAAAYHNIGVIFESPKRGENVGTGFLSRDWDLKLTWVNNWNGPVSFKYRFVVKQSQGGAPKGTKTFYPPADIAQINFKKFKEVLGPLDYEIDLFEGMNIVEIELAVEVFEPHTSQWIVRGENFFRVHIL